MHNLNSKLPTNIVITSILFALFANIKFINQIVLVALPSLSGGFMASMYGVMVPILFIVGIFFQKRSLLELSRSHITISFMCLMWYLATMMFIATPSVPFAFFGVFTLAAFLIPGLIRIDVRTFLLVLMITSSVGVFYVDRIIINSIMEEGVLSMGICYSMLVPVIANLIYIRYFFLQEKRLMKIALLPITAINIFYLVQMTMFGSRGPVFCVTLLLFCLIILKVSDDNQVTIRKGYATIGIILVILVALYFVPLLKAISGYLEGYDISLNVVDKFLRLDNMSGDLSNGRDAIDIIAWDGIFESPFLGYGTAQFENNTGFVYPHNFILQFLYDGGLLLTFVVLFPIVRTVIQKIKKVNSQEYICLIFLFFCSVPGSLLSGDLWEAGMLWMFFGFVLSRNSYYKLQL